MSSQYRNFESASDAPAPVYLTDSMNQSFQRPAQMAYADYQNYSARDNYSSNLPPVELEDRSRHHYPSHHIHHRRHGEVSVSHSHHLPVHHEYHHVAHHRPYHHHNYSHAETSSVNVGYSHHRHSARVESTASREESVSWNSAPRPQEQSLHYAGPLSSELQALEAKLARTAVNVASRLRTVGDCAHGPRLAFDKLGYHLPPAVATEQGKMVRDSGLFDVVPASQVRPGDYGVRDWSHSVVRQNGSDKGDSFIVTGVTRHGAVLAANDHTFVVPADGGRYTNLKYYRPNEEFVKRYGVPS